jgi:hypothetical protein
MTTTFMPTGLPASRLDAIADRQVRNRRRDTAFGTLVAALAVAFAAATVL